MNSNRVLVSLLFFVALCWMSCDPTAPSNCPDGECASDAGARAGGAPIGGGTKGDGGGAAGGDSAGGAAGGTGGSVAGGSAGGTAGGASGGDTSLDAGLTDAGACELRRWFFDADQDGFGFGEVSACTAPAGTVAQGGDCDDHNPLVSPAQAEVCDALLVDENCRQGANEGCGCVGLGSTRSCCSGRGQQVCVAADAGTSFSTCDALTSTERCNGIDDDCNGQIDDLDVSDGGSDAGEPGASCSVGVGACRRSAMLTCSAATVVCAIDAGVPTVEQCNGLDDDCDGQVDDGSSLCSISGQSCVGGSCVCPQGEAVCGAACMPVGRSCSAGVGVCRATGVDQCVSGALQCSAVPGTPRTETCNGVDDDCDGAVDEAGPQLCTAVGQVCGGGTCSCPSGQGVCGGACIQLVQCVVDADDDTYAGGTVARPLCPDASRMAAGQCPAGFVAPANSRGADCDDTNASLVQAAATRTDADGDTACTGQSVTSCMGLSAPAGRRFTASCASEDDCNDADTNRFRLLSIAGDADQDTHCTGPLSSTCIGASVPAGFTTSCVDSTDCNDGDPNRFRLLSIAGDADQDTHCTSPLSSTCIGASVPAGFTTSCVDSTDCNDGDRTTYQLLSVRPDQDGDTFCSSVAATARCSGATPSAGFRLASACAGTDCNDADRTTYQLLAVRADADGDARCFGAEQFQCSGATPGPGLRLSAGCLDDCNDGNSGAYQILSVRTDFDGDGACIGGVIARCSGASVDPGYRATAACAPFNDCNDNNFNAGEVCALAYQTSVASKSCGIGPPPTEYLSVAVSSPGGGCPVGFHLVNLHANLVSGLAGACTPSSPTVIEMRCPTASFGSMQCALAGTCSAF